MKAITIRNIPPELARAIRRKTQESGLSFNKAVIALLEERHGQNQKTAKGVTHHDLDDLAGTWSREEAAQFDKALRAQRQVDEELWK
jgi:hypothetical protein